MHNQKEPEEDKTEAPVRLFWICGELLIENLGSPWSIPKGTLYNTMHTQPCQQLNGSSIKTVGEISMFAA